MATKKTTTTKNKSTKKSVKKTGKALSYRKNSIVEEQIIETVPANNSQKTTTSHNGPRFYQRKQFIYGVLGIIILGLIVLGIIILGLIGYYSWRYLVIGVVDGQPISKLSYYKQLDERYGKNLKEELFTETLINSEAKKLNVAVEDSQIDAEVKKYQDQQGGAEQFNQALTEQGYTMDDVRKGIKLRLLVNKIFASQAVVTDEEVTKYITDNQTQFPEASDSAKAQVKDLLISQKVGQVFNQWLTENIKGSRVVRY